MEQKEKAGICTASGPTIEQVQPDTKKAEILGEITIISQYLDCRVQLVFMNMQKRTQETKYNQVNKDLG